MSFFFTETKVCWLMLTIKKYNLIYHISQDFYLLNVPLENYFKNSIYKKFKFLISDNKFKT